MKTPTLVRLSVLAAALVLAACGNDDNNQADGGTQVDAGPGDAGVVDAGPPDAGLTPCTPGGTDCPMGESCTFLDQNGMLDSFCVAGPCDLVAQDCPAGEACGFTQMNGATARACVAAGTAQEGEACSMVDCAAGLICVGAQGSALCARFCNVDTDCMGGLICNQVIEIPNTNERPLVCGEPPPSCDLLTQDCAAPTEACFLSSIGPVCQTAGTTEVGQPCTTISDCVKGAICITGTSGNQCAAICGFPMGDPTCQTGMCRQLQTGGMPVLDGGIGACGA